MRKFGNYPGHVLLIIVSISLFLSCNKKPEELGIELVEGNPLAVDFSDTTSVRAYSVIEDSVRTDQTTTTLLGSMYDPVMGKTTASVYTQVSLTTLTPDFGVNPVCDSMVLILMYSGYYGDTLAEQTFRVYELNEEMSYDTAYYSINNLEFDPVELANYSTAPRPTDSVLIGSEKYEPQLRIPMNNIMGDKVLTAPSDVLEDNEAFINYFKGIYITADPVDAPGEGAVLYFNFLTSLSKILIYYHNNDTDSLEYTISLNNAGNARFGNYNHYDYDHASPEFISQVIEGDSTLGSQFIYCQAMGGVKGRISFPYLMDWYENGKIAINEAKLIFTNHETNGVYEAPETLSFLKITEEGSANFLVDQEEGSGYFGGTYDDGKYSFRITRHLQQMLNGDEPDLGFYLLISGASLKANRLIIKGKDNSPGEIKLEMIYTRVND